MSTFFNLEGNDGSGIWKPLGTWNGLRDALKAMDDRHTSRKGWDLRIVEVIGVVASQSRHSEMPSLRQ